MAGRGPAPKTTRRNKADVPIRGEWKPAPGVGWQHEPFPAPPDGLLAASRTAWDTWMHSWFAAHWTPDDLPALRQLVRLYDEVERGEMQRASELRLWMDTMGVTPKGQQDRRWTRPDGLVVDSVLPDERREPLRLVEAGT
jgi:hypothetical protein